MNDKLDIILKNIPIILTEIMEFFCKMVSWLEKVFILYPKERLFKKFFERKEIKKVCGEAFNNVLENSYLNPNLRKRGGNLATRTDLKEIIDRVDVQLREKGRSPIFAHGAFPTLLRNIKKYVCLLISESINISEQGSVD